MTPPLPSPPAHPAAPSPPHEAAGGPGPHLSNRAEALIGALPGLSRASDLVPGRGRDASPGVSPGAGFPPLAEIFPAAPGHGPAACGFALALAVDLALGGPVIFVESRAAQIEDGRIASEGLVQLGLDPQDTLLVEPPSQSDALWACEEALRLPRAVVILAIPPRAPIDLVQSRRLLLAAQAGGAAGLLVRADAPAPSAAFLRWRVGGAAGAGPGRLLSRLAFDVELMRNRQGPTHGRRRFEWTGRGLAGPAEGDADASMQGDEMARGLDARSRDRPSAAVRGRAAGV